MSTNVSKYISYAEATKSQTATRKGIDNKPNAEQLLNMQHVAINVFDKVREHFGVPLTVSSFFRCDKLNKAVGGSKTSQHPKGEAIDIDGDGCGVSNKDIYNYILKNLPFDQLINEYPDKNGNPSWVHVSLKRIGKNRKQTITVE